jgi:N-acyl-D-aspartate/D-glutamate deacylase
VVFALDKLVIGEVHSDTLARYEGWTVGEVASDRGCHPIDALLDVALEDDMKALFVTEPKPIDVQAMRELINSPFALPGVSDGGAHTKFITLGRYPTEFLALLVRDNELMDLEQAHWRLSAYPALAAGVKDRGWLREGAPADIVVYELKALSTGTAEKAWDFPAGAWRLVRKPEGYRHILVNGEVTFRDNECTGAVPGRLLRHGQAE